MSALSPHTNKRDNNLTRNRMSHVARIRAHILDERGSIKLTDAEEETYKRIKLAMSLRIEGYTTDQVVKALKKEFGVGAQQADRDMVNAISLYGDVTKVDKQGHRHAAAEMSLKAYRLALKQENPAAMVRAIESYMKALGLDKEDAEQFDYSKLDPHVFPIVLDEVSQQALQLMASQKGPIDLSKIYASAAVDVESTEVSDDGDQ